MDWMTQLAQYVPQTPQEAADKAALQNDVQKYGTAVLERSSLSGSHICCSGMILDPTMTQVLLVYHNIYQSFSWTGGHADGESDFLAVAIREAQEETGLQQVQPLCSAILSIDRLPVKAHIRRGEPVAAHFHDCISFGLLADPKQPLRIQPAENSAVCWKPIAELPELCQEPHMLPVYEKLIARMKQVRQEQQVILSQMVAPLLDWYAIHKRDLPWRKDQNPYHVWISEIMLQQTRVEAVKGYYQRFLTAFPIIQALAEADPEQVRKCWEGLGYYTRAKNLQRAAQQILEQYHGEFPTKHEEVLSLAGIGAYTAGAICSICYEQPTPAVDGNVLRVVMRLQDIQLENVECLHKPSWNWEHWSAFRMEHRTVRNVQLQHSVAAGNKKHKLCCLFGRKKLPDEKNSEWSGFCSVGNDMQSVSDRKADCWQGCGNSQTSWER